MTGDEPRTAEGTLPPPNEPEAAPPPGEDFAKALRGFGLVGIVAILAIYFGNALFVPAGALLVLAWAWRSNTPWREIGFGRPKNWAPTILGGIVFGIALKFLMKAIVMPLLGADPINQAYHFLAGNRAAIPYTLYLMIFGAGFGEETLFRGFAFERLGKLFGNSAGAKTAIVLGTAIWFGSAHYSVQGLAGAEQAFFVGLTFGSIFAATGRIWMLMFAHAAFDLTAYVMIYWDLETKVAHLIFK